MSDFLSFLNTGHTFACFHLLGNIPVSSDLLNNFEYGKLRGLAQCLRIQLPIPSGPEDLLVLILRSNDSTSFSFSVILSKRVSVRHLYLAGQVFTFSVKGDIDAK